MTPAELCRARGWGHGDIIEGIYRGDGFSVRALITAVGEAGVLGRQVGSRNHGFSWSEIDGREEVLPLDDGAEWEKIG